MPIPSNYPYLTNGLVSADSAGQDSSIISSGLPNLASAAPIGEGNSEGVSSYNPQLSLSTSQVPTLQNSVSAPSATIPVTNFGVQDKTPDGGYISYAGVGIQALLEIGDNPNGPARFSKQLIELTTISISVHRATSPARSLGFIGARGYARGGRTVAGTMVFTQFTRDVLAEFLTEALAADLSKDTTYIKPDQLPSFNLTLLFTNEYGYMSYRRLLGISFVTDGTVYSVNDLFTEQTMSYVASDFSPLLPLGTSAVYNGNLGAINQAIYNPLSASEKTPLATLTAANASQKPLILQQTPATGYIPNE